MLLGSLAAKSNPPQMLSIKTAAVARLFNTYIGELEASSFQKKTAMEREELYV